MTETLPVVEVCELAGGGMDKILRAWEWAGCAEPSHTSGSGMTAQP